MISSFKVIIKKISVLDFLVYAMLLLSLVLMAIYTQKFLDYFYFKGCIEEDGIYRFQLVHYFWWDGRFFSLPALVQSILIKYLPHTLIITYYVICFAALAVLYAYYTKTHFFSLQVPLLNHITIITFIFFYGSYSHIAQTLFWAVGGAYMFGALLFMIFLFVAWKLYDAKLYSFKGITFIAIISLAGGLGQNVFPATVIFFLYILVSKWKSINKITFITALLGHFTSIAIIVFSPGNFRRSSFWEEGVANNFLLWIQNFLGVLYSYSSISILLIISLSVWIFFTTKIKLDKEQQKAHLKLFLLFTAMALSTITPFMLLPQAATPRTSITFMICIAIAVFHATILLKHYLDKNKLLIPTRTLKYLPLLLLIGHFYYTVQHVKAGQFAINQQKNNEHQIITQKKEGVNVIKIREYKVPKMVFSVNYTDACLSATDSTFWINEQLANYYRVKYILATEE